MAYMNKEGGPYPNKAGEYCGNHKPGSRPLRSSGESSLQAAQREDRYLANMRWGRPRGCDAGTREEMEANGWVGLYWEKDSGSGKMDGDVEVPTPHELMEPPEMD